MNTIYDNTFVLGSTSALTFEEGPGIKIDSPSAGTVRIGTDETVLYDGGPNGYTPGNGSATTDISVQLTESIMNFERIRISMGGKLGRVIEMLPLEATTSDDAFNHSQYITGPDRINNTAIVGLLISIVENNSTKLRFRAGYSSDWAAAYRSGQDWGYYTLFKIVGINRISGNA